jgi:hypothetical protein
MTGTWADSSWQETLLRGTPKQRFATVANGQERSVAGATELRERPLASSPTARPKLA